MNIQISSPIERSVSPPPSPVVSGAPAAPQSPTEKKIAELPSLSVVFASAGFVFGVASLNLLAKYAFDVFSGHCAEGNSIGMECNPSLGCPILALALFSASVANKYLNAEEQLEVTEPIVINPTKYTGTLLGVFGGLNVLSALGSASKAAVAYALNRCQETVLINDEPWQYDACKASRQLVVTSLAVGTVFIAAAIGLTILAKPKAA